LLAERRIKEFKKAYAGENVFIFKCSKCERYIFMHEKDCPKCATTNNYYDPGIQIREEIQKELYEELGQI